MDGSGDVRPTSEHHIHFVRARVLDGSHALLCACARVSFALQLGRLASSGTRPSRNFVTLIPDPSSYQVSFDNWSGQPAFFRGSRLFTMEVHPKLWTLTPQSRNDAPQHPEPQAHNKIRK